MKKALLIILVLFAGMLIAGTFDAQTAELEKIDAALVNGNKTPETEALVRHLV